MEISTTKGVMFPNGLPKVVGSQSRKHIAMNTSHPLHMQPKMPAAPSSSNPTQNFASLLQNALQGVEKVKP